MGAGLALLPPVSALAHSFGRVDTLPLPFWLYAWAAASTLILSFLVVGWFATNSAGTEPESGSPALAPAHYPHRLPACLLHALRALSGLGLLACVLTGLFGTPNPYGNFNMTFFWVLFVLGFAYATALIGDLYALINPWRLLCTLLARVDARFESGRFAYPRRAAYWPALLLYMGFIWFELFGRSQPYTLARALLAYSTLNVAAAWLFGARAWFRHGEFFAVFLRLIAKLAPVEFERDASDQATGRFRWRAPGAGLMQEPMPHWSLLVFILFMLSSTAFDGLHETRPWHALYWTRLYPELLVEWVGANPLLAFPQLREWYRIWQTVWLLASPFLYLLLYLAGMLLMRELGGSQEPLRTLALRYAYSLLPIALAYHCTHYYTLIQTQGIKIIALISDPFGRGQNWFGTARWYDHHITPDMNLVWHLQVLLIVLGHIAGVVVAHRISLRDGHTRCRTVLAQLPLLGLMVLFTIAGLWILAQPLQNG